MNKKKGVKITITPFFLCKTLFNIIQQVFAGFETDAEADRRIWYRHFRTLFGSEEAEDGGRRMDGQRLAVEEVRGTTDNLEFINEGESGFFRFEVYCEDGTR